MGDKVTKQNGKCVICGSSRTVKAHLFPRALMFDLREGNPQLVAGHIDLEGVRLSQSGEWDDQMLCEEHEILIGRGDDYGVRFCRTWSQKAVKLPVGDGFQIPNGKPDLLLHFAYAVIWRHALSGRRRAYGPDLGPKEPEIRRALLAGGPYELKLLIGTNPITINRSPANIAVTPSRVRVAGRNTITFTVGGLDFYLKTDHRPFREDWAPLLANGRDPLIVGRLDQMRIEDVPRLAPLLRQMKKSTWRP